MSANSSSTIKPPDEGLIPEHQVLANDGTQSNTGSNSSNGSNTPQRRSFSQRRSNSSSSSITPSGSPLFYSNSAYNSSVEFPTEKISLLELLDPLSTTTNSISKRYNKVKQKSFNKLQDLKNNTSKKSEKYIKELRDLDRFKKNLLDKVGNLDQRLYNVFYASATEKIFYSLAIYAIFAAGFIVGFAPEYFHIYYTVLSAILLPIRFYVYYKKAYHYFLADLCYYVNILLLLYIWVFPWSKHLYISCFAFTFGTLSWAIITWRNSLVLHSIDKTTSSFIHITPPVVMLVITHHLPQDYKLIRFPGAAELTQWNFISGILWTSLYYLIWQSLYHYFITVKRAQKIKAGRITSFEWLRKSFGKNILGKFVNSLPDPFPVVAFTLIQYFYQLLTMSICPIWFAYRHLASSFITFIFLWASYNGATYYVDYYGKRLEKEVARLQKEIEELQTSENETFEEIEDDKTTPSTSNASNSPKNQDVPLNSTAASTSVFKHPAISQPKKI
ncbi:putative membrane protein [Wickerhamomyces ciferrii]|uniref:Glycerophosphocholine acyltransferase 1 n=1 Tax=Wickerhamomyces ciferrii (strain ATCC 14091 / BCRC 22168 / CBS 111 / JCM 3599 / NBRC 0793 / NRRL Y-1031 F-60-10) TaxID=1206466 RepID=K0KUJ2_WICCF|nr:uncharacterized protein BN7_4677 [Wickerhamomyces ciferrii]CCH45099.1 putative membrane protein [Wickerhamomyces ciferrii]